MEKKYFQLLILLLLFSISLVSASEIETEIISRSTDSVAFGETAHIILRVENIGNESKTLRIITDDPNWIIDTNPKSDYLFNLDGYESKTLNISIKPSTQHNLDLNKIYEIEASIFDDTNNVETSIDDLNLRLLGNKESRTLTLARCVKYKPDYDKDELIPGEKTYMNINFSDSTCQDLNGLEISYESELFEKITTTPNTKVSFRLDEDQKPGIYQVKVKIKEGGYEQNPQFSLVVKEHEKVSERIVVENKILGLIKIHKVILSNEGNIDVSDKSYKSKTKLFDAFRSYTPDKTVTKTENGTFNTWTYSLKINETTEIVSKTNYIPLFLLILTILVIGVYKYVARDRIEIVKKVTAVSKKDNTYKIVLTVKNKSNETINKIKLNDKIPNIAVIESSNYIGTVKPNKILKHDNKGTMVVWDIEELAPKEERLLYYIIKSKLDIIGSFTLPSAIAKCKNIFGKITKIYSNKANILAK